MITEALRLCHPVISSSMHFWNAILLCLLCNVQSLQDNGKPFAVARVADLPAAVSHIRYISHISFCSPCFLMAYHGSLKRIRRAAGPYNRGHEYQHSNKHIEPSDNHHVLCHDGIFLIQSKSMRYSAYRNGFSVRAGDLAGSDWLCHVQLLCGLVRQDFRVHGPNIR